MRYRLCTLLIVLAIGPPILAWVLFQCAVLTARYREHGRLNWVVMLLE